MSTEDFSFVHLSDIHVIDEASAKFVEKAFEQINQLSPLPDFVMIGGDFVENGTQAEFDAFLSVFGTLNLPVYTLCGNHDLVGGTDPTRYQRIFGDLCYAFDHKGYHCLALDTTHRDYEAYSWHGYVREETLAWLKQELLTVGPDKPILLFTHHGLVGNRDDLSCDVENADEVLAQFTGHTLIAGFAGHAHRLRRHTWRGIPFYGNTALSISRSNPGGEPCGFFVAQVEQQRVSVAYHLMALEPDESGT